MHPWLLKFVHQRRLQPLLCCGLCLLAACTPSPEPERVALLSSAVVGGEVSERDAVVLVGAPGKGCTATLVAPNLIVTSLSCVAAFNDGSFKCTPDGTLDESATQGVAGTIGEQVDPSYVSVWLQYDPGSPADAYGVAIFAPVTDTICRNNLAFVLLDRELEPTPASIRTARGVSLRESLLIAGFGTNDIGYSSGRYERSGVPIVAVGESEFAPDGYGAIRNTFAIASGACPGDGGGPAFSDSTGALLGVLGLRIGGRDCVSPVARNFYTQIASFQETMTEAFAASGYSPILEVEDSMPEMDAAISSPKALGVGTDAEAPTPSDGKLDAGYTDAGHGIGAGDGGQVNETSPDGSIPGSNPELSGMDAGPSEDSGAHHDAAGTSEMTSTDGGRSAGRASKAGKTISGGGGCTILVSTRHHAGNALLLLLAFSLRLRRRRNS